MAVKKWSVLWVVVMCLLTVAVRGEQPELTGRQIMEKVENRPEGDDQKARARLILINHRGKQKERSMLTFSKTYGADEKSLIFFVSPASIRGTGFLTWEYDDAARSDDRWLYLPALRRSRRITSGEKNDYFLGTDFTYEDLGSGSLDDNTYRLLREENLEDRQCWVVEAIPRKEEDLYSRKISWIWKDALMGLKVDYYDRSGSLMKTLWMEDIRKQDGFWTAFKMRMENFEKKHKTLLVFDEVRYNLGLTDSLFQVTTLERGQIQ